MSKKRIKYSSGKNGIPKNHLGVLGEDKDSCNLAFTFAEMPDGEYSVDQADKDALAAFTKQLKLLSSLTWKKIKQSLRHGQGCEKISRKSLNVNVPANISDDAEMLAFRFYGKRVFVGFRSLEIFHILFLDTKFTLYDHE